MEPGTEIKSRFQKERLFQNCQVRQSGTNILITMYWYKHLNTVWILPLNVTICLLKSSESDLALFVTSLGKLTLLGQLYNFSKFWFSHI